ncbi:MOSC domain-containing protein [Luteococcus sediminum]
MEILSTNIGRPREDIGGYGRPTGHDKRPVASITLSDPGPRHPRAERASGVEGDFVGDREHHGGRDKAVYAVGWEDLELWSERLGVELPAGWMGENLTTLGRDLNAAVVGEKWRIGDALLQVCQPRIPCRTFQVVAGRPGWIKQFTAAGGAGAYLRVLEPGTVRPGDRVEVLDVPEHGVGVRQVFRARTTHPETAGAVLTAREHLPDEVAAKLLARQVTDLA